MHGRDEPLSEQLVGLGLNLASCRHRLDVRRVGLLLQQFVVGKHPLVGEVGLDGLELELGIEQRLLHLLISKFQDHRVGFR